MNYYTSNDYERFCLGVTNPGLIEICKSHELVSSKLAPY